MIRPSLHTHLWTMDTETYKYLKNETFPNWKENVETCFPPTRLFGQKYFPQFHPSIGVYNEFLELHSVKQRVSAGPVKSQILTYSSIFGTPVDSEAERIIRPIPPACKYTNPSQKCTVEPRTRRSLSGGGWPTKLALRGQVVMWTPRHVGQAMASAGAFCMMWCNGWRSFCSPDTSCAERTDMSKYQKTGVLFQHPFHIRRLEALGTPAPKLARWVKLCYLNTSMANYAALLPPE